MYERLSAFDASLLDLERPTTPLHLGGVSIFGEGLSFADVHDVLRTRLAEVPLARRRLRSAPFGAGMVWVDDVNFDLSYHLRHAALPHPGSSSQLGEFLSRLIARPLDRSRPLWELYVIEGLRGGRSALFRKSHLAMAGGDGVDPFAVLLSEERGGTAVAEPDRPWRAEPPPSDVELAVGSIKDRVVDAARVAEETRQLLSVPSRAAQVAAGAAGSAFGMAARAVRSAPRSPLNRPLTEHRRFAMARADLADLRAVRATFGGTINDAVVAVCADAVGRLLRWRGYETKDLDLRVMVPVRVDEAAHEQRGARSLGEGAVGVLAPLPVMEMDPVARLYRIMGEMAGLKESRQAVAADRLATIAGYAPATLHAIAARLVIGDQRYNVALSNAPGPQHQLWLIDAPLEESYPFIPLAGDAALSIAVSSYAGVLCFGLLGDRRAVPDLDRLAGFVTDAVDTLVEAARA